LSISEVFILESQHPYRKKTAYFSQRRTLFLVDALTFPSFAFDSHSTVLGQAMMEDLRLHSLLAGLSI
jgi:hypothetical protein